MSIRQPLPPWIVVSGFILGAAAIPLAERLLRPPVAPPHTLRQLIQSVGASRPSFHVVLVMDLSPEAGVYFCERPQSLQQLMLLPRAAEYADRWQGVVYCERIGTSVTIPPEQWWSWGEHGIRIGSLVFFGDPDLLRRIHQELLFVTCENFS